MAIIFKEGSYPPVTLVQDYTGCIHLWEGTHNPTRSSLPLVDGKEAPLFFQFQSDIEAIYQYLTDDEKDALNNGYTIVTQHIPDDYFITD